MGCWGEKLALGYLAAMADLTDATVGFASRISRDKGNSRAKEGGFPTAETVTETAIFNLAGRWWVDGGCQKQTRLFTAKFMLPLLVSLYFSARFISGGPIQEILDYARLSGYRPDQ